MHSGLFFVIDIVAQSYVSQSSQCAGSAAELGATRKSSKYGELSTTHFFVPIALESLGPVFSQALSFHCKLGQRTSAVSGNVRETAHLFQRLLITMQHFNCDICLSVRLQMARIDYDELA